MSHGGLKRARSWKRRIQPKEAYSSPGLLYSETAGIPHGPWRIANSPALSIALPNAYFVGSGSRLWSCGLSLIRRTAGCGPACPVVWQGRRGDPSPYADSC